MTSTSRTARCGPACRVVWQGRSQRWLPPMPIDSIFGDIGTGPYGAWQGLRVQAIAEAACLFIVGLRNR